MLKAPYIIFLLLLLIYMVLPGPSSIDDFPPVPSSAKSTLEGDTIQVPNVAGYFSNSYRSSVVPLYQRGFKDRTPLPFPPIRLDYPPEYAFVAIKDQTHATFLEELVYPLRDSLFVNGLEHFEEDGSPKFPGATPFRAEGQDYNSKTTLRFYPSVLIVRLIIWGGIALSLLLLNKLGREIFQDG